MSASLGAARMREGSHTLVPCGTGLEALFHIPAEGVLQTPVSCIRHLPFLGHQPGRLWSDAWRMRQPHPVASVWTPCAVHIFQTSHKTSLPQVARLWGRIRTLLG